MLPEITDAMIADGSWVTALTEMVEPIDAALGDLLARAFSPGAPELRGRPSRSDRLEGVLRETADRAALSLERALSAAAERPAAQTRPTADPRAELEAMGVRL